MIKPGTFLTSPVGDVVVVVLVGTDSRKDKPEFPLYNILKLKGWVISGQGPFEYDKLIEFILKHRLRIGLVSKL